MGENKTKNNKYDEEQKRFGKEDLQDFAKIGGDFLKKKVVNGIETLKEATAHLPKEATQFVSKGKEELLKSFSQETARNLISFGVEKIFDVASKHKLEFSIRIKKNTDK